MWWPILLAALLTASCGDDTDTGQSKCFEPRKADDGSLRIPFLGGEFATWNTEFPPELEQAAKGLTPDKPVIVWAGND